MKKEEVRKMKHKITYSVFLLIVFFSHISVWAQNIPITQRRLILLEVVTTMEDYKRYAAMDQDFTHYKEPFLDLFTDLDAPVYNDLIGLSREENVTAMEYADLLCKKASSTRIEIKNILCEGISRQGGRWTIVCSFDKMVNLSDECKVEYSSTFFNEEDYHMRATLVYQEENERCAIEKIECSNLSKHELPEQYRVFRHRSKMDDDVKINGVPIRFNAMEQAFVPMDAKITHEDPEVIIKLIEDSASCNLWHIKYKTQNLRVHLHYDMPLGDYYSISKEDGITTKNSGSEFGADFGYTFSTKSKAKFSINGGLLIANSKIDLAIPTSSYSYVDDGSGDVDHDSYTRHYVNVNASEKISMTHLGIPVYADLDFCFSRFLTFYIQTGIKPYLKMSAKLKDNSITVGEIYGVYSQYNNLRLDGTWGYNGFGKNIDLTSGTSSAEVPTKSFSMDLFGDAGFRIKPLRSAPLAVELGLQYQMSILDMWEPDTQGISYSNTITANGTNAISHYTTTGGEQCKMLNAGLSNVKRQHMKLNIGLIYKF